MPSKYAHYKEAIEYADERIDAAGEVEEYLDSLKDAPEEIGWLFAADICQDEVLDAGFEQFFFGFGGMVAPEAVKGFEAIGQVTAAGLLKAVLEKFGPEFPRDRFDRLGFLDDMDEATATALADLETAFIQQVRKEAGGYKKAADRFAAGLAIKVK